LAFLPIAEGSWKAIYIRLLPVFQVFFLTTSEAWLYWLFITRQNVLHEHEENKQSIAAGLTAGAVILLLILIIAVTGMGIGAGTQFWGKAGCPSFTGSFGLPVGLLWPGCWFKNWVGKLPDFSRMTEQSYPVVDHIFRALAKYSAGSQPVFHRALPAELRKLPLLRRG
jgi:hypothetical protein